MSVLGLQNYRIFFCIHFASTLHLPFAYIASQFRPKSRGKTDAAPTLYGRRVESVPSRTLTASPFGFLYIWQASLPMFTGGSSVCLSVIASLKSTHATYAHLKSAPLKSAPLRFVRTMVALNRSAPLKSALDKSRSVKSARLRSSQSKVAITSPCMFFISIIFRCKDTKFVTNGKIILHFPIPNGIGGWMCLCSK